MPTRKTTRKTARKPARKTATGQYVVTAKITMRSGKITKTAAEKLRKDTLKRAPNATISIKRA